MIAHPADETIHDHADGTLAGAERAAVEHHLAACARCAARHDAVRALLARAASAPRAIEPGDDLWPEIRARLRPPAATADPEVPIAAGRRRPRATRAAALLAAGIAIAVASSLLTARLGERGASAPSVAAAPGTPAAPAAAPEAPLAVAADELAVAWRRANAPLEPATAAALDSSLRAVDDAILETRRALERTPNDPLLAEILSAAYRRKVDLLRRALTLPAQS